MKSNQKIIITTMAILATVAFSHAPAAQAASATYGVTLNTTVAEVMTLTCDAATVNLGSLTPGTPVTGTSVCTGTTNGNGYTLSVIRDDATSTLDRDSSPTDDFPDFTVWNNTTTGNAAVWAAQKALGFTVFASTATKSTSWWGAGTTVTDAANKYAGFPTAHTATTTIMDHSTYAGASTTSVGYKIDALATQKAGAYSGSITYSATSKP